VPSLAPGTNRAVVAACLAVVWVLWGSVYLGIRLVIDDVPPSEAMAQRFLLAGIILGVGLGFAGLVTLVVLGQDTGGAMPVIGVVLCLGSSLSCRLLPPGSRRPPARRLRHRGVPAARRVPLRVRPGSCRR